MDPLIFFLIALSLALLLAVSEVAAAFVKKSDPLRAVFCVWAYPFYGLYLLLTFLIGMVLVEQLSIQFNWTNAIALGLMGPALFKTQMKLFLPISGGKGEVNANIERIISSVQIFCFEQIGIALARHRIALKHKRSEQREDDLIKRLQLVAGTETYQQRIEPLLQERQHKTLPHLSCSWWN